MRAWCGVYGLGLALLPGVALGQPSGLRVTWSTGEANPAEALLPLNADDDDDDRVPDLVAPSSPEIDDELTLVTVEGATTGAVRVTTTGGARVLGASGPAAEATLPVSAGRCRVYLQGAEASAAGGDASVTFTAGDQARTVRLTVVVVSVLHGDNEPVHPWRDAVGVSHEITHNDTLPRTSPWADRSPDPDNLRVELWDPGARRGEARLEALGASGSVGLRPGQLRGQLTALELEGPDRHPLRSRFVRLVGDELDLRAPGVSNQTLRVGLRDRVRVRYRRPGVAGEATTDVRVGRPGDEDSPLAARRGRWHIVVVRDRPVAVGGRALVGRDDADGLRIAREQVAISNEVYLQCMITFGEPSQADVTVADPPPPTLLSVGDDDGYRAAGGVVRLRVNGRALAPVTTLAGWRPLDTALALSRALTAAGFTARVTENARTDYGAGGSADLLVRDASGRFVTLSAAPGSPLTTDPRQRVQLGVVDLYDGLEEFNNLNSASGTLEERALFKPLMDEDPGTIDLLIVNRFTRGTRIGEAFVEGDSGALLNALVLDRTGIQAQRDAWTQSHEAGHILLNQPWHPDNMGPDRPWLLMDADASLGAVTGPKRLTPEECRRIHAESGVGAVPALLTRYDPVAASARAGEFRAWPPGPLYPRPAGATAAPGAAQGPGANPTSNNPPGAEAPGVAPRWPSGQRFGVGVQ
ncbi:MAG: hypothetical protein HY909_14885 [Deltaproteobacteria bacterium]|nr:hypothetical protein [Deltaproteobacteria bacterium]